MKLLITIFFLFSYFSLIAQDSCSIEFEKSKGHWLFPVSNFKLSQDIRPLITETPESGLLFLIEQKDSVRSVFQGTVQSVFNVGNVYAVMIRYGRYFVTYAYLDSVVVKKGQEIKQGKVLGYASNNSQGMNFILSDLDDHIFDPLTWFDWSRVNYTITVNTNW